MIEICLLMIFLDKDLINLILVSLALCVAIITLFTSMYYNRKMLEQTKKLSDETIIETKELYKKLINAQLFNSRYDVIQYFQSLFSKPFKKPENFSIEDFELYQWKMQTLFTNYQDLTDASTALYDYFRNNKLTDFTSRSTVMPLRSNEEGIKDVFGNFYVNSLRKLENELGIKES